MQITLAVLVTLAVVAPGLCSQCYVCNSQANPSCKDPFTPGHNIQSYQCGPSSSSNWDNLNNVFPGIQLPTSPAGQSGSKGLSVCYKIIGKASSHNNQREFTIRDCSYFGSKTCEVMRTAVEGLGGQMYECETCEGELCNSAPGVLTGTTALFAALLFAFRSLIV